MKNTAPSRDGRSRGKKGKPAVAFSSEAKALENIRKKVDALGDLLEACENDTSNARSVWGLMKASESVIVPTSLRQFLAWTDQTALEVLGLGTSALSTIGNGTIDKYPELHAQVAIYFKDFKKILRSENELSESTESKAKRALRRERERVGILEEELIRLRCKLRDAEDVATVLESELRDLCKQHGLFRKPTLVKA